MSSWRDARNEVASARLRKAMPPVFPAVVLVHALARSFVPPLPRLAVESYWRHHPVRADRLARALAARAPAPEGWRWRLAATPDDGRARSFRAPPAPFREAEFRADGGTCCLCGQPVYRFGWHRDLWGDAKTNRRARWHACCVAAWKLWNAPADQAKLLARLQKRRCAVSGQRLSRDREVDHRVPLHRVWRQQRDLPWAALLRFWGFPNLQAINRDAHRVKSAAETSHRAAEVADRAAESRRPDNAV